MYLTAADRGDYASIMHNWPSDEVDVVVVTDGSRILGLGDLGANGMGIPIGKLILYVAAGGIRPTHCLPVMLDFGCDNEEIRRNPFYLGADHERLKGPEYIAAVDEFVHAVKIRYPNAFIQFEDFSSDVANYLLDRYKLKECVFNDDI
jgi:malic enzyme